MARTNIAAQTLPLSTGSTYYPATPLSVTTADLVLTAVDDPTDRNTTIVDGKTVVIAHNTDSGAHTITITSQVDDKNRLGSVSTYSIAAGKIATFGPFKTAG